MKRIFFIMLVVILVVCTASCSSATLQANTNASTFTNVDKDTDVDTATDTDTDVDTDVDPDVFENEHWSGCPLFVDDYNAIEWYIKAHSIGYDVLFNPDQRSIVEYDLINSMTEKVDYHGLPTFWYPLPVLIQQQKYLICREGHYFVLYGEDGNNQKHIHWQNYSVNPEDEICFSEEASYVYTESTLKMYSWGVKRVETKLPKGSVFIDTNESLGLIFYNESKKEMYTVSADTCTVSKVKNVSCVLTANYRAGSVYDYPLIITKEGTFIYFGDKYNQAMAKLYDEGPQTDTDFGDHVMRKPKYSENNIPWAGDTGL